MSDHELDGIAIPKIYGFTTPEYESRPWEGKRDGKGLIKIGFTSRDPQVRILEQVQPVKGPDAPEYELLAVERAFTEDGDIFRDKAVHKELERAGVAHSAGEWYECTKDELLAAIAAVRKGAKLDGLKPKAEFEMRPEQRQAVEMTSRYFQSHAGDEQLPHFLWNAKMRFGKTFTAYQLAKEMGWNRILVLTYKPAAKTAWREDLEGHKDFEGWRFKDPADDATELDLKDDSPLVWFSSFQDALGSDKGGSPKAKNELLHKIEWDCVVVDEFHFGAWRDAARSLYLGLKGELDEGDKTEKREVDTPDLDEDFSRNLEDALKGKSGLSVGHFLYLSGTPFRALANGDFLEDQIFNWTYADEQRAKKDWRETKAKWDGGERNPYEALPTMKMLAYEMPEDLKKVALNNQSVFSLSEFFRAAPDEDGEPRFVHENEVQRWLDVLRGQDVSELWASISNRKSPPLPFEDTNLLGTLQHTIWYLPGVDACLAMAELLGRSHNKFFSDYEVLVAAGKDAGMGAKALDPVEKEIGKQPLDTKTITLTCGKLLTGVTVPAWTGIFMLRELKSPETYFQAAFRVQSPWARTVVDPVAGGDQQEVIKEICFILDFDPNRALTLVGDYAKSLSTESAAERDHEAAVAEFIEFLPILCFDGFGMNSLEPAEVIDYFTRGTTSSMLARRWNSSELITLDMSAMSALLGDPDLLESLEGIEMFRNIKEDLTAMISSNKELEKKKITKEPLTKGERKRENVAKKRRDDLKKRLQRFLTRIPAFMYLTELREKSVKDVITKLEPDLFKRVTALEVDDFQKMLDAGVFNDEKMNDAVWKFREFERPSLSYASDTPQGDLVGGFNVSRSDRFAALMNAELISAGDLLVPSDPALDGVEAEVTDDFGLWIGDVRYASPRSAARRADGKGDYSDDEAMSFWVLKDSGKTLAELEKKLPAASGAGS